MDFWSTSMNDGSRPGRTTRLSSTPSRTTIAFALVDRAMPGEGCDRLVRHGCAFLQGALWDAAHGGFFAQVDRGGRPCWEGLKHPHAVTYAAQAFLLAEPYLPPGEGRLWAAAPWHGWMTWRGIRRYGGYWGSFRRNNERYPDGARLPTPDGRDVLGRHAWLQGDEHPR